MDEGEARPKLVIMREPMDTERIELANERLSEFAPFLHGLADICAGEKPAEKLREVIAGLKLEKNERISELRAGAREDRDPAYLGNWQALLEISGVLDEAKDLVFGAGKEKTGTDCVNASLKPKA